MTLKSGHSEKQRRIFRYFPEKLLMDYFEYLPDCISNSMLYNKCGSILLSRAIIKENLNCYNMFCR